MKITIRATGLDTASAEDLKEAQKFLRRQTNKLLTAARPRRGKAKKTYKATAEIAMPVPATPPEPSNSELPEMATKPSEELQSQADTLGHDISPAAVAEREHH